jgi:hypothetical protein
MPENEDVPDVVQVPSGDDQLEFNLGEGEQGAEIEISEDGKAEIKEPEAAAVEEKPAKKADDGQDHEEYSAKVKKRIEKMTAKLREAERREQAALEYAKQIKVGFRRLTTAICMNIRAGWTLS